MRIKYLLALALIALVVAACGNAPAYNTPTPEGYQASPTEAPTQAAAEPAGPTEGAVKLGIAAVVLLSVTRGPAVWLQA
jgi:uncharacterized lipoprotein